MPPEIGFDTTFWLNGATAALLLLALGRRLYERVFSIRSVKLGTLFAVSDSALIVFLVYYLEVTIGAYSVILGPWPERVLKVAFGTALAWTLWRTIDMTLTLALPWAQKTKSSLRVTLPVTAIILRLAVIIIPIWYFAQRILIILFGFDLNAILVGAGVVGLVLGFALQDTLSNLFAGLSLRVSSPFEEGDLIVLSDGKVCRVDETKLRTTRLYNSEDHSVTYVPNNELANSTIVNITEPTVDLKIWIDVGLDYTSNIRQIMRNIVTLASAHPCVLLSDLERKKELLTAKMDRIPKQDRKKYHGVIRKLRSEKELDIQIANLKSLLEEITEALLVSTSATEIPRSKSTSIEHLARRCDGLVEKVVEAMEKWKRIHDPWAEESENKKIEQRLEDVNNDLERKWDAWLSWRKVFRSKRASRVLLGNLIDWLDRDYKPVVMPWKNPSARFLEFGQSSVNVRLTFYVDNITLEHFERKQRVLTELAKEIHAKFGNNIPFPQMDIHMKK